MTKPLTYRKPNGDWGIEGVDLSTLHPQVYGALAKLMELEHPLCGTRAETLRAANDEDMAEILAEGCCHACDDLDVGCVPSNGNCHNCWLDWLLGPASIDEQPAPQKDEAQWKDWLRGRFEREE